MLHHHGRAALPSARLARRSPGSAPGPGRSPSLWPASGAAWIAARSRLPVPADQPSVPAPAPGRISYGGSTVRLASSPQRGIATQGAAAPPAVSERAHRISLTDPSESGFRRRQRSRSGGFFAVGFGVVLGGFFAARITFSTQPLDTLCPAAITRCDTPAACSLRMAWLRSALRVRTFAAR